MTESELIEALKALAHPLRWRILTTLATGEHNVGEIEQVARIGQPGLSQQLGVLRKARLVDTRKEAKLVFYSLAHSEVAQVTAAMARLSPMPPKSLVEPEAHRSPAPGVANFARMS